MEDLRTELDKLDERQFAYVIARSKTFTDAQALLESGLSRNTFYKWEQSERDSLNNLAQQFKRETALRALMVLQDNAEKAAETIGKLMDSRNENIKLRSAQDTLDRTVGKAAQPIEVSGKGGGKLVINLSWDDDVEE